MPVEEFWLVEPMRERLSTIQSLLAVDVGANRGTWTAELSGLFSTVIAVEPDKRASSLISRSANVEVVEAAVSSKSGEAVLYLREQADQNSLLATHPIGGESCVDVPPIGETLVRCITLDELCPDGADLVKIDVEGAEGDVLRGCSSDGRWSRTMFVVECHDTKADVANELARLGKSPLWVPHVFPAHPGHCWAIT